MPRPSVLPADLRTVPFTVAQARQRGLSGAALEGARFRSMLYDVYVAADQPLSLELWVAAARLVVPGDAVVHHLTGLHVHGVWVGAAWPLRFASTDRRHVRRMPLQVARVQRLPPADGGVATAASCFAAGCADLDLVDAVTAGDQLLHLGRCTHAELTAAVAAHRGRGAPMARRALALVRERSESPRETLVRLLLVLAGLPEPRCNVVIGTGRSAIGRGDMVYDGYALVVEYDGRQHADSAAQWERDLERLDDFADSRWRHIRVTAARLRRPRDVVWRVHAALTAAGYAGPAPSFGPDWVELFERRTAARRAAESPRADSWSQHWVSRVDAGSGRRSVTIGAVRAGFVPTVGGAGATAATTPR
ncbi:MAG: hypothetical protein H0U47_06325 [Nocardioidaceae bacterium]|nr:hypothetical protein [Nocardioidaceae bacterium]